MSTHGMNRRAALRGLGAGLGVVSVLWIDNLRALAQQHAMDAHMVEALQAGTWTPQVLSSQHLATVGTLVDAIIPATDTPGARALQVDRYVDWILSSADRADRERVLAGVAWLDARSQTLFGAPFASTTPAQQADLLTRLSAPDSTEATAGVDFFNAMKMLTINGYYTTEAGLRQELGDDGRMMLASFEGCTHQEHQ